MVTLKASVAAAVLAGTAVLSAGAGYALSRATITAQVAVSCPQTPSAAMPVVPRPNAFPPLGNLPSTTGGQKF